MGTLKPLRRVYSSGPCRDDRAQTSALIEAELISGTLAELVRELTAPLFVKFDFFEMRIEDIELELDRMRGRSND